MVRCRRVSRLIHVTCTTWRTLGLLGAFPTRVGGHHFLGATFLYSHGDWYWQSAVHENGFFYTKVVQWEQPRYIPR